MITLEHRKEGMSRAYALAVGFKAGMNCISYEFDYKIDGSYKEIEILPDGTMDDAGYQIDFQLKASKNVIICEDSVIYDLDAKNYNSLVKTNCAIPRILILLKLPENETEWLNIDEDCTKLKNCAWYCSLSGQPITNNQGTKRITIPRAQIFTPETLTHLMERLKSGDKI